MAYKQFSVLANKQWLMFYAMLAWFGYVLPSVAQSAETNITLYTIDYPPYTIESNTKITGIDVDVVVSAFAAVGVNANIQTAPWKRIIKNIQHGRILGTLSCSRRKDREAFMLFSDPISEILQVAITSDQFSTPINVRNDLKGLPLLVVEGWGVERELQQLKIEYATTPDMDSGLNAVVYRGAGVFYTGELVARYRARQLGLLDKIKITRLADVVPNKLYLCLSKSHPNAEQLITLFNEGLATIMDNGEYDKIYKRYLLKE